MSYRGFNRLRDELGNEIELRETWINPEKDIWRWMVYRVENPGRDEVLHKIGNNDGTLFATALSTAAGHFKMLRENWIETQARNKYSLDWSQFSKTEQKILSMFKALYDISRIRVRHSFPTGFKRADSYIIKNVTERGMLGENGTQGVEAFVYPSGVINIQANGHEFNLTILAPEVLNSYYSRIISVAKRRCKSGKIPKDLNMTAFRKLVKELNLEKGRTE